MTTQPHMKTVDEIVEEFERVLRLNKKSPYMSGFPMGVLKDWLRTTLHQQRKEILEEAVRRIEAGKWKLNEYNDTPMQSAEKQVQHAAKDEDIAILQTLQKEV